MNFIRSILALSWLAALCGAQLHAEDAVLDGTRIATQGVTSKGQNCPSNSVQLEETSNTAVWTVAASPERSFDFGKIEIPLDISITPHALVILEGQVDLCEGSYLEVGLQLADGRYFFANLKGSDALSKQSFEFPISAMASSDGNPFTDSSAQLVGVSMMICSDGSDATGNSEAKIGKITVVP